MTESSGNVFADLGLPQPLTCLAIAAAKIGWNRALDEGLPDWAAELLNKLK